MNLYKLPVEELKGVGKARSKLLARLGLRTISDVLFNFPNDYQDRTSIKEQFDLTHGKIETVKGTIISSQVVYPRPGLNVFKLTVTDGRQYLVANWFNQAAYLQRAFPAGSKVILTGRVKYSFNRWEMAVEEYNLLKGDQDQKSYSGIIPIYSLTKGISQRYMRHLAMQAIDSYLSYLDEVLPLQMLIGQDIPSISWCIKNMHFPESIESQQLARKFLAYRELAFFQLALLLNRIEVKNSKGFVVNRFVKADKYMAMLPFSLTSSQLKAWQEIKQDLKSDEPMSRLLQGDVGSGKTVVAVLGIIACCESGFQGVLMAPTEILAKQHYLDLTKDFAKLGFKTALLTGGMPKNEKQNLLKEIAAGEVHFVVGTHAIIQDNVKFRKLGLAIIDEQHRFGVNQRTSLQDKGTSPNMLIMTATPIPRTLALTMYGDLDVSNLFNKPLGRGMVITKYVSNRNRIKLNNFIKKQLDKGRQTFVVCPLIEENDVIQTKAVEELEAQFRKEFAAYSVGLIHGKLPTSQKDLIMDAFRLGKLEVLIGTTVVEVGINVPNANIMVIEGIERFGLSQLHQLRGRICRSPHDAYCFLLGDIKSPEAKTRAKAMCTTDDGFKIAEIDLKLRGPGELYGVKQHGMPEFRVANLITDYGILVSARKEVKKFISLYHKQAKQLVLKNNRFINIKIDSSII